MMTLFGEKEGSAEAATSPSHGSNHSHEEKTVNGIEDNAGGAGQASRDEVRSSLDALAKFEGLLDCSIAELNDLHFALTTIVNVSDALMCTAFRAGRSFSGNTISGLSDFLANYREVVVQEARGRIAQSVPEAEDRAALLIQSDLRDGWDFEHIADEARSSADLVRDLYRVEAL